jgi:hypothetical protein
LTPLTAKAGAEKASRLMHSSTAIPAIRLVPVLNKLIMAFDPSRGCNIFSLGIRAETAIGFKSALGRQIKI